MCGAPPPCAHAPSASIPSSSLFVSGRGRHTRFKCDWSSDVCSSDLTHTHIHTHTHRLSLSLPFSLSDTHPHNLSVSHSHTHTHTHTHTHSLMPSRLLESGSQRGLPVRYQHYHLFGPA